MESYRQGHRMMGATRHSQAGMTALGFLILAVLVGAVGFAVLKVTPMYIKNMRMDTILEDVKRDLSGNGPTPQSIRYELAKRFSVEDVNLDVEALKITQSKNGFTLRVQYDERASYVASGLTPVINATGVVLHTNLGRAPLPARAAEAAARAAGYGDLEVDRRSGERGRRTSRAEAMLLALIGAEDALVVNNCAAALLLSLAALAKGRQVLVSRGELIEIGGEFRIPDIVAASGAKLVEVGTTNRTRLAHYPSPMPHRVAAVLSVYSPGPGKCRPTVSPFSVSF